MHANVATIHPTTVTPACVIQSAKAEHVPLAALVAIMAQEGGQIGKAHENPDRSYDYGPMQVNSRWLPTLRRYGISRAELEDNGCVNVLVGAWILRRQIKPKQSQAIWAAIGHYHSHNARLSYAYQHHVWQRMNRLAHSYSFKMVLRRANGQN